MVLKKKKSSHQDMGWKTHQNLSVGLQKVCLFVTEEDDKAIPVLSSQNGAR